MTIKTERDAQARRDAVDGKVDAFSIREVLARVPLSRTTVMVAIRTGALRSFKIGRRRLIAPADLAAWLDTFRSAA